MTWGWYLHWELGTERFKGLVQPVVRYQRFDDASGPVEDRWDVGLNWYVDGHNAKLVLLYSRSDDGGGSHRSAAHLGFQFQF